MHARRQPAMNRLLAWVLRSPLSGMVDGSLLLLTVRGRRTGRAITLPVQYAAGDDAIWVWPGNPQTKAWWRNLRVESAVRLRLRGQDVEATAKALEGDDDLREAALGLRAYADRFPRSASRGGFGRQAAAPDEARREAVKPTVIVRIDPPEPVLRRTRAATLVHGRGVPAAVRRHRLAAYFLLAYAFSWGYWLPVALTGGHLSHFPGLLGPMLSALLVTAIVRGWAGLRDVLSRMGRWRVPLRCYGAAVVPLAAGLLALGGLWLAGRDLPSRSQLSTMPGLPALGWVGVSILVLVINGYGEETGWRGFAWPRLRERHGLGGAAMILAIPWAVWHVPTFWLDTGMRGFPLPLLPGFLVGMAAGAVVLGWLYERARSSLLIVALFHALLNMASATKGTEGSVAAAVSTVVILWAVAILRVEGRRGGRQQPRQRSVPSDDAPRSELVADAAEQLPAGPNVLLGLDPKR